MTERPKVLVIGAGRVGAAIVRDLAADCAVTVADHDENALTALAGPRAKPLPLDARDADRVQAAAAACDLVVGAVPGQMGFALLRTLIPVGRPIVDISFFPEDPFDLEPDAQRSGVPVAVDCGIAPGMNNLLLGHLLATHGAVDAFRCYVGGLPQVRTPPWKYQAPFSPIDVIEEYTRPARVMRDGAVVTLPALSEPERLRFDELGELEAFNTDGLRTLLRTADVPTMTEKTLRYPGHRARIEALRDAGLFGEEFVTVGDTRVRPIDVAAALLLPQWLQREGDRDLTVMRVEADVRDGAERRTVRFDLLDRYDTTTATTSMARTTGYTCTSVVRWFLGGGRPGPGITPPETLGRDPEATRRVLDLLAERGVRFARTEQPTLH